MSTKKTVVAAASKSAKPSAPKAAKPTNKSPIKPKAVGALTAALDAGITVVAPVATAQPAPTLTLVPAGVATTQPVIAQRLDPKGVAYPTGAQIVAFNAEAGRIAMRDVMPGLVAKHGTPNPIQVEGKRYIVDPACEREYTAAKASLVQDMVSRAGLSLNRAPMISIEVEEQNAMSKTEEQTTASNGITPKASKAKHEKVQTPHGEFRVHSIMHGIYRSFDLKGGATKAEILERLVKEFPERDPVDMASTINTQVGRMPIERKFTLGRSDQGRYGLHIVGQSKVRILSPEQAAKVAAREAAKVQADAAKAAAKATKDSEKAAAKAAKDAEDAAAKAKAASDKAAAKAAKDASDAAAAAKAAADKAALAAEAAKKSGITVNVPGAVVVGKAASKKK